MKKLLSATFLAGLTTLVAHADQPNILWLVQEDASPWMGCYGHEANAGATPVVDKLAKDGVLFTRAYTPTPVCSTCRSSFITGANAIRWGGHEHRSRRGKAALPLQPEITTLPELFIEAGYFTFNVGKTDYNFIEKGRDMYSPIPKKHNGAPWRAAPEGKPFFGQIQLKGGKIRVKLDPKEMTDPKSVTVPADYPQNDLFREVVAQHCDAVRTDDKNIARILATLDEDGLTDNTIVVYFSDHGANNLVRHKQFPTEAGLHVPCMVRGPRKWVPSGVVRDELISILDISATTLAWAGIKRPAYMEGRDLFAKNHQPREWVASAKDRLDHTIDRVRTIRTDRYRYTRNFMRDRIHLQPQYRDGRPFLEDIKKAYADGTLAPKLAKIYFGERPEEELYDMEKDPAQVNNLAADPAHAATLKKHRKLLDAWLAKGDLGEGLEPDVELEVNGWAKWGKGVNPEYERIRSDSDGDGLSDEWETINNRDPKDGRLQFEFDCGGWQDEGWTSTGTDNIAGMLGTLDFTIGKSKGTLHRTKLKLDTAKNTGALRLRVKSNQAGTLSATANGKSPLGSVAFADGKQWQELSLPLSKKNWNGTVSSLDVSFTTQNPGATITIDWIRVGSK